MTLNIRTEELDNRRLSLTVEVDQDRVDEELHKAARKVGGQVRIPGFRLGKAPYNLVVQHVGLSNLYSEFLDTLGNEIYPLAVEQAEIEPYAMASLDISSLEPLTYTYEVPLEPVVDLGDYRSLRVEEEELEVTDEEMDERLSALRSQMAGWTEVDRPSEYGDMLTIDVKSILQADADADDATSSEENDDTVVLDETDWDVTLDEENPMEPDGLDQELLGMSPGEEKEFVLSWPEDSQSIYAGKSADFKVNVHTIQANLEPELDDEFAKKVNEEYETLEDLTISIREAIEAEKEQEAQNAYVESVLDALVEQSEMDYPPVVVEDQIDSMVTEFSRQLQKYGIESLEAYLTQTGMSMEEYRETLREQAAISALRNLVISELYQREGITVNEDEMEERIEAMSANFGGDEATDEQKQMSEMIAENMRSGPGRTVLESQIIQEKALERLLAIARGEEVPEPGAVEDAPAEDADDAETDEPVADEQESEIVDDEASDAHETEDTEEEAPSEEVDEKKD